MTNLVQILVSGLTVGSVLALVALGYNLVFSTTRIVNFAQGSMIVVAGYLCYSLIREPNGFGLPLVLAFVITVVVSALVGLLIEVVAVRPLGRFDPATNVAWILTTFSVSVIAIDAVRLAVDARPHPLPPLVSWRGFHLSGVAITGTDILIVGTALGLMVLIDGLQRRTMLGKAFRAVAQDRQVASLMGINTTAMVMLTFALAGALAAIGAVLLAPKLFVKLDNGLLLGVQAFIAAVLGGLGSTRGAIIGGYSIAIVSAIMKTISPAAGHYEPLVIFALFLLVLVVRPSGILGQAVVDKV